MKMMKINKMNKKYFVNTRFSLRSNTNKPFSLRLNKRASETIDVVYFVIGVFIVCTAAIASFLFASEYFKNNFYGMNLAEQVNSDVEQFYGYINLGYRPETSALMINAQTKVEDGKLIVTITKEIDGYIKITRKIYYPLKD